MCTVVALQRLYEPTNCCHQEERTTSDLQDQKGISLREKDTEIMKTIRKVLFVV